MMLYIYIYIPKQNQKNKIQNKLNTIFAKDEFPKDVKINQTELDNISFKKKNDAEILKLTINAQVIFKP